MAPRTKPRSETVETEKCGLGGGDPFKRDNFKDLVLKLMVQVTSDLLSLPDFSDAASRCLHGAYMDFRPNIT